VTVRRALIARAGVAGAIVALGLLARPPAGPAEPAASFEAVASGGLIQTLVRVEPAIVQSDLLDPGAVTAQARLTSLGDSTAFASHPYPGAFPLSLPGLASSAVLQGSASVPEYPFVAASSHPSRPEACVSAGSMALSARSRGDDTTGEAADGVNRAAASAAVDRGSGRVTARAEAELVTFDLGPSLSLTGLRSTATTTRSPGGEVQRRTEFTVDRLLILGREVRVTPDGLELAGTTVAPGLAGPASTLNGLMAALATGGTTIKVLPPVEIENGATSAGLEISQRVDMKVQGASVVTVTSVLGRSSTWVADRVQAPAPVGLLPGDTIGPVGAADPAALGPRVAPASGPGPAVTPRPGEEGTEGGFPAGPGPDAATAFGDGGAAVASGGGEPSALTARPAGLRSIVPERSHAGTFYPVLVLGGAALVALTSLLRKWGVKPAWTS
jgi:hypothetical protein